MHELLFQNTCRGAGKNRVFLYKLVILSITSLFYQTAERFGNKHYKYDYLFKMAEKVALFSLSQTKLIFLTLQTPLITVIDPPDNCDRPPAHNPRIPLFVLVFTYIVLTMSGCFRVLLF